MKNKIIILSLVTFIAILFLFIPIGLATDSTKIIEFKDQYVEEYFLNETYTHEEYDENGNITTQTEMKIDENGDGKISVAEMEKIETINFYGENAVTDYSFFKYCKNLRILNIKYQGLEDISFLSDLKTLKKLVLNENNISDISVLKNLTNLEYLNLSYNNINDISPVKELINLKYLDARSNQISDVSCLSELTNLEEIAFTNNKIKELSISNLEKLTYLSCDDNEIEKIILKNLPEVFMISLSNNDISDLSNISGLDKIYSINLNINPISDISPISNIAAKNISLVDTLVNPYDEATFHILCTWLENGKSYLLGDCSQFLPRGSEYTTEKIEEVNVGEEKVTVMPIDKQTTVEGILTESSFPVIDTYTIKVLDANGNEKAADAKVGSRNIIQITDEEGQVLAEYTIVVSGDVNGDGETKIFDSFQILKDVLMSVGETIDAIELMIRDFNNDGNVRIYDAFQFLKEAISK